MSETSVPQNPLAMSDVSIVIPIGSYHEAIASGAIASAKAQTVPCEVIEVHDGEMKGTGAARNTGLAQVKTSYVVFLDADDQLLPTFVEDCLKIIRPNRYVYTDWLMDDTPVAAPDCAWTQGTWHVNTCLLPTDWVRGVGGYDEYLPGAEDTELFFKLTRSGCCGIRLPKPLFIYRAGGQRSAAFILGNHHIEVLTAIRDAFKDKVMGCCGDKSPLPDPPPGNEAQQGDVLVMALWAGNNRVWIENYQTPRTSYPRTFYMPAQLAVIRPDLVRIVPEAPEVNGQVAVPAAPAQHAPFPTIEQLGKRLFGAPVQQTPPPANVTEVNVRETIARAQRLFRE